MQAKLSFNAGYTIRKICPTFMLSLVYMGREGDRQDKMATRRHLISDKWKENKDQNCSNQFSYSPP